MIHQGNQLNGTKPVIFQTNTILSWILMGTNKACWVFPILHFLLKLSLFAAFLTEKIWWVGDVLRVDGMKPARIRSWRIPLQIYNSLVLYIMCSVMRYVLCVMCSVMSVNKFGLYYYYIYHISDPGESHRSSDPGVQGPSWLIFTINH